MPYNTSEYATTFQPFLRGKVALITGSTSGIGLATAHCFAAAGADVVLNGRHPQPQDPNLVSAVAAHGTRVEYIAADMMVSDQIENLVAEAKKRMGRIDVLVNNAGIQYVCPFESFPMEKWNEVLQTNLTAPFHLMQLVLPIMREQQFGRIVNISSIQGLVGSKDKSAYNAAKHGLNGLTKSFTMDTAPENITCNAICPGYVHTPLVEKQVKVIADAKFNGDCDAALKALLAERTPSLQYSVGEEIGNLAVYLCSPTASNMKGALLTVDGGLTVP